MIQTQAGDGADGESEGCGTGSLDGGDGASPRRAGRAGRLGRADGVVPG